MAKAAKTIDVEITDRIANKFLRDIMEHFENIESARGTFMNRARKERDAMTVIYESMAAKGISQKSAKTNVAIVRLFERAKKLMLDLEIEERKMVQKLAKAQGDKRQMMLFGELPAIKSPTRAELREREKTEAAKEAKPSDLEGAETIGAA